MEAVNWKFWRRKPKEPEPENPFKASIDWVDGIHARGFRHWFNEPPPHGVTLEIMRREWAAIHVIDRDKVRPETNIYGLWWKLADGPIIPGTTILDLSLMAPRGSA